MVLSVYHFILMLRALPLHQSNNCWGSSISPSSIIDEGLMLEPQLLISL